MSNLIKKVSSPFIKLGCYLMNTNQIISITRVISTYAMCNENKPLEGYMLITKETKRSSGVIKVWSGSEEYEDIEQYVNMHDSKTPKTPINPLISTNRLIGQEGDFF
jgi:hypothetical protein